MECVFCSSICCHPSFHGQNSFLRDRSTERMLISWNDMDSRNIRLSYDDITSSWWLNNWSFLAFSGRGCLCSKWRWQHCLGEKKGWYKHTVLNGRVRKEDEDVQKSIGCSVEVLATLSILIRLINCDECTFNLIWNSFSKKEEKEGRAHWFSLSRVLGACDAIWTHEFPPPLTVIVFHEL